MFKFAIKNLLTRKSKFLITMIAIFVSTVIVLFSYNVARQINDGMITTATYYDVVVGPNGSSTDLVLSAMFFTGTLSDTVDASVYNEINESRDVMKIVPIATGDNYKGNKIIGTTSDLLDDKTLKDGVMFEEPFEMIIGNNIAKKYNLKVGDDIIAAHGVSESSHSHEKSPYKVTGILEKTYTVYDDVLFTSPESVWNVHEHHDEEDVESFSGEHTEHDENEEHDEHSEHYGEYTALLIKTRNPSAALTLIDDVNKLPGVLAVNPSTVLRNLMESIDTTTVIVYVLCAIIAVMSFIIIYMINLMIMQDLRKDIVLMRLLGLKRKIITEIVLIQNALTSLIAMILSFAFTRIALVFANNVTVKMGVVMNYRKVYSGEYVILVAVFVISMIPTIFGLFKVFRKELGDEK